MTWHYENRRDSGVLRRPCDGQAWKYFDKVHPDFAAEPRNVRLGLCSMYLIHLFKHLQSLILVGL